MPVLMLVGVAVIMTMVVVVSMPVVVIVGVTVIVMMIVRDVAVLVDGLDAGGHGNIALGLRVQGLAECQHQGRSEEREQGNQPDGFEKIHVVPTTSASRFHPPALFPYCGTTRSGCPALPPLRPPRR